MENMRKYIIAIPFYLIVFYLAYWTNKVDSCSYVIEKAKEENFEGVVIKRGIYTFNKGHYVEVKEKSGKIRSLSFVSVEHTNSDIWYEADKGDYIKKRGGVNRYYLIKKDTTLFLYQDSLHGCIPNRF